MSWTARVTAVLATAYISLSSGCAAGTCEQLCQWFDDIRIDRDDGRESWETCQATCEDDYAQAQNYCRDSLRDASSCVADVSPGDDALDEATWAECSEEVERARDDCGCGLANRSETCAAINSAQP